MKPDIGNHEYTARHQKVRMLMEKNYLDALLITEPTNLFHRVITESEADFGWVIVCIGDFDPRQAAGSSQPGRRLEKSDLLWVDLGIVMHGYHTDYCRGLLAGSAIWTR